MFALHLNQIQLNLIPKAKQLIAKSSKINYKMRLEGTLSKKANWKKVNENSYFINERVKSFHYCVNFFVLVPLFLKHRSELR